MVQLNLNFTHVCRHTRVLARSTRAKLKKLACARNFGVRMQDSKHTRHTRDACHELALGFTTLHVWCNYRYSSSR